MTTTTKSPSTATTLYAHRFLTRLGEVLALVDARGVLRRLSFLEAGRADEVAAALLAREALHAHAIVPDAERTAPVRAALEELLAGRRLELGLPIEARGTPFQLAVWRALRRIPRGETRTYAQVAAAIGRPRATRAVGRANAANPIAVATPCHRVIGADGALTGFFGGVAVKRGLLELERGGAPGQGTTSNLTASVRPMP